GNAIKNVAETIRLRDLLHFRTRIGDRNKMLARFTGAHSLLHAFEKILLKNIRLERAAGLARNNENRFRQIDRLLNRAHLRRIGRLEHMTLRVTADLAER